MQTNQPAEHGSTQYVIAICFIATLGGLVGFRSVALALADAGEIRAAQTSVLETIGRDRRL